ncbi:hypothetical protein Agub_g14188, partial [Astrephomene gubernaculifera]
TISLTILPRGNSLASATRAKPAKMARPVFALVVLAACMFSDFAYARDECFGPIVEVKLLSTSGNPKAPIIVKYGALAGFGSNLSQPLTSIPVNLAEPLDACGPIALPTAAGTALLVIRGNCSFTEKARVVQSAGAAAMLLYDNEPGCVAMGAEPNATAGINIAAVSVSYDTGLELTTALQQAAAISATLASTASSSANGSSSGSGGGSSSMTSPGTSTAASATSLVVSLRRLDVPLVDGGAVLLWLLAVGTVLYGSLWSGADYLEARRE